MSWKLSRPFLNFNGVWGSLAFRLTAGYASAGLLLFTLSTLGLYFVLTSELDKSTGEFLGDKVNVVRTILQQQPPDLDGLHEEVELESASRRYEQFYICLRNGNGKVLLLTPRMQDEVDLHKLPIAIARHGTEQVVGKGGNVFDVTAARVASSFAPDGIVIVQVAVDVSRKEALLRRFRASFLLSAAGLLLLFPLVGYRVARQGIRPVQEIATTARRITSSHLGERIVAEGYPYELASLAVTINKMLDGLEDSFGRISRFSADIAHDLRTPVNNIRGEAEVALARGRTIEEYREALESTLEEAVHLSDLIGNLLFLARAEQATSYLQAESVDLVQLLEGVREYYEASAAEAGVTLCFDHPKASFPMRLDRTLMQRAVGNLISNAIAHTPEGGTVRLEIGSGPEEATIQVIDTGIGIPADALPRVFDRFYRVDPSRSKTSGGTGLGLSIVEGIMHLHRGKAEIVSQLGLGTRVILRLPRGA